MLVGERSQGRGSVVVTCARHAEAKVLSSTAMASYTRLTTLEDAYFFLNQGSSIPEIASSERNRQRFLRAAILFGWTAVEDGVNGQWTEHAVGKKRPESLELRVNMLFRHLELSKPDGRAFNSYKRLRNAINHPSAELPEIKLSDADAGESVRFCYSVLKVLFPDLIIWTS